MASVIHRTTLQYLSSVNEPDFPESTWKHNPNMTAVAAVPNKYWKAPADWNGDVGPVEMTQGEKDTVNAAETAAIATALENRQTASQPGLSKGDMAAVNATGKIKRLPVGNDDEMLCADSAQTLGVAYKRRLIPVLKTSNETRTANTTLANDSALLFPVVASGVYIFRGQVFFDTTAAGDFKFSFSGPASPTSLRICRCAIVPGGTAVSVVAVDTSFGVSVAVASTGTTGGYVEFNGVLVNGSNGGNVAFQWAQNASDAGNTIVRGGSVLEWVKAN